MTALELLKKWRWQRIGKEFEKVVVGLIGLAVFFVLFCGAAVGIMLRCQTQFDLKTLLILAAALLALWSLFYFFGRRDNNRNYTAIDNNEMPEISLLFYGGWYRRRSLSEETALCAIAPYCLEVCCGGLKNIVILLFLRLDHLGEVTDFLLRNPRRITLAEIEAEELPVFDKYLTPLIGMEVCQLLESEPIGVCVCGPFKKFCLRKLGIRE